METKEEYWEITFEEKNDLPEGYSFEDYESKDFINSKLIQDFPLRGRAVFLRIKRRRWRHMDTPDYTDHLKSVKKSNEFSVKKHDNPADVDHFCGVIW